MSTSTKRFGVLKDMVTMQHSLEVPLEKYSNHVDHMPMQKYVPLLRCFSCAGGIYLS